MFYRRVVAVALISTLLCLPTFAQSQSDKDLLERIRKEVRHTLDVVGAIGDVPQLRHRNLLL